MRKDNQKYVMDDGTLQQLIREIEDTYQNAEFFDKANYSKELQDVKD